MTHVVLAMPIPLELKVGLRATRPWILKNNANQNDSCEKWPNAEAQTLRVSRLTRVFEVNDLQLLQRDQTFCGHLIQYGQEFLNFFLSVDDFNNHR